MSIPYNINPDLYTFMLDNIEAANIEDDFNENTIETDWLKNHNDEFLGEDSNMMYADLLQLDVVNLKRLTPFQPGRGYFVPVLMPRFMEKHWKKETAFFRSLLTLYATGVEGIQDPVLNFGEVNSGVESQNMEVPTNRTGHTNEITFQFPSDFRGQFITTYLDKWMNGIVDMYSDKGHYYGEQMAWTNANHCMSGVYFTTDPSERMIEFACYLFNMMPKNTPLNINNKTKGENNPQEISPPFTAQMIHRNHRITEIAESYLKDIISASGNTTEYRNDLNVEQDG